MKKKLSFMLLSLLMTSVFAQKTPKYHKDSISLNAFDVSFIENKGQVHDQFYNSRPDILFSGTDGRFVFHIKNNGISYYLNKTDRDPSSHPGTVNSNDIDKVSSPKISLYRVDIELLKTRERTVIEKDKALVGFNNYYLEHCPNGIQNVSSYEGVTIKNIYDNIHLHYYQSNGHLKYDYIVAPFTDYKQIQFKVKGSDINIEKNGCLILRTPFGDIVEGAPIVYQKGKKLKSKYVIKAGVVSFEVENHDPSFELIIDPLTRFWGTYYGGTSQDVGNACVTDPSGNVFMAGQTSSSIGTQIATIGSHQTVLNGVSDAVLVKFNSSGVRQWGTYYGGSGDDLALGCATDALGNVYIAGQSTGSSTVISTPGSHQPNYGGGTNDAFIAKFNSAGVRQWGTYYGGVVGEYISSVRCDNAYLYLTGRSNSTSGIATASSHQPSFGGNVDAFLLKFDLAGVRQWGTYYGGAGIDEGFDCSSDASGNIFLTGSTTTTLAGTQIATPGSHQPTFAGTGLFTDAFLIKFNAAGIRQWGTFYGTNGFEVGCSCRNDATGNVYLAGYTSGNSTVLTTPGSHQPTVSANAPAFLVKFNTSGVRQWGTYYGQNATQGLSCAIDASDNILLAGYTTCTVTSLIAPPGSYQTNYAGNEDGMMALFNTAGVRQWGTYYGGPGDEKIYGACFDNSGNIYITGVTSSSLTNDIASPVSHQSSFGGLIDGFLVKFRDCLPLGLSVSVNTVCAGGTLSLTGMTNTMAINYNWTGPNSFSSTVLSPTIANVNSSNAGAYSLNVSDANGCLETAILTASINTTNISVNSGSICNGNTFTMIPSGANTYTFQGGNSAVSPTSTTSYTVVGTSTTGCVSQSFAISTITVVQNPTVTVNSGTICAGNSFTIIPSGASTYTFQGGNSIVNPASNTSYTVLGTNSLGCISTSFATSTVTVLALPLPTVTANSGTICNGASFTINPSGASTYTIQGGNSVVTPSTNSSYTVIGSNTLGCISQSFAVSNVTVLPLPGVLVTGPTSICVGETATFTASGANTYSWNTGSVATIITVTPTVNTIYSVHGTSSLNGCSSTATVNLIVDPCTGLSEKTINKFETKIYPNPNNGNFTIELISPADVSIFNSIGDCIYKENNLENKKAIDLSKYSKGIYFILINSGFGIESSYLIIQ